MSVSSSEDDYMCCVLSQRVSVLPPSPSTSDSVHNAVLLPPVCVCVCLSVSLSALLVKNSSIMPAAELQCCSLYTSCDTLMIYLSVSAALLLMYDLSARGCRWPAPSRRQLLDSRYYYYYYPSRTAWLPGSCFTGASASRLGNSITFIFFCDSFGKIGPVLK